MNRCNIVKDLIPLHVEGLTSEESAELVEQHIAECDACRQFYGAIKRDYESHEQSRRAEPSDKQRQIEELIAQLGKYQRRIKLVSVLVAMLMTCVISGAEIQFLSTIPFLILTPFACRLYYPRSLPIIVSAVSFSLLGGLLSENNSSYIPFFTVVVVINAAIGVGAAVLVKQWFNEAGMAVRSACMALGVAIVGFSCAGYFSFWGNPVGYMQALIQSNDYVNRTYEKGTLDFKGVQFNFKDKLHYGKFEYVMNGVRQTAMISIYRDGTVMDDYKFQLGLQFSEERSADLKAAIAASVYPMPLSVQATKQAELRITKDELDDSFYHLSFDPEKRRKAAELRASESGKLGYEITFGAFSGEYEKLSKETFLSRSASILRSLKEQKVPFQSIKIKAMDANENIQSVSLTGQTTEQQLADSYRNIDPSQLKK